MSWDGAWLAESEERCGKHGLHVYLGWCGKLEIEWFLEMKFFLHKC